MGIKLLAEFLGTSIDDKDVFAIINTIRKGVSPLACKKVADRLGISISDLGNLLNISDRTLMRYEKSDKLLPKPLSDHLVQIANTILRAEEVFEDKDKARRWLLKPCRALGDHSPLNLLDTFSGGRLVENELGRIEWGVYS